MLLFKKVNITAVVKNCKAMTQKLKIHLKIKYNNTINKGNKPNNKINNMNHSNKYHKILFI